MARVILREMIGGILILAGLAGVAFCISFLSKGYIIEGGLLVPLSAILVAAGTRMLNVALAVAAVQRERGKG